MNIKEIVNKYNSAKTKDDWLQLEKDMTKFLKEDHPQEEKRLLAPLGYLEVVCMTIDIFDNE